MGFRDSCWNISESSLAILAAAVFETSYGRTVKRTVKRTDTNAAEKPTSATTVGVGKNYYTYYRQVRNY